MSRHVWVVVALLGLSISGCVEFQHPLSPPEKAELDRELFGSWYSAGEDENGEFHRTILVVGAAGEVGPGDLDQNKPRKSENSQNQLPYQNFMRVVQVDQNSKGQVKSGSWLAWPTHVGALKYANVPVIENGAITTHFYWKYELDGDQLSVWTAVDKDAVDRMIEDGKLHKKPDSNQITENSEELQKILANGGDAEWFPVEKKITFRKLKLPE